MRIGINRYYKNEQIHKTPKLIDISKSFGINLCVPENVAIRNQNKEWNAKMENHSQEKSSPLMASPSSEHGFLSSSHLQPVNLLSG